MSDNHKQWFDGLKKVKDPEREFVTLSDVMRYMDDKDQQIKDLSLRIAVALRTFDAGQAYTLAPSILTMPIESLHEFIKNNPQYGEATT